jgi:hypothetical protein
MRILDTNSINYILKNNLKVVNDYFVSPDVREESEVAEIVYARKIPNAVKNITSETIFNKALYLENYRLMLNKHGGRSFFNMTGFGDISILALIRTLTDTLTEQSGDQLFETPEEFIVYTEDNKLIRKIKREFPDGSVTICDNSKVK